MKRTLSRHCPKLYRAESKLKKVYGRKDRTIRELDAISGSVGTTGLKVVLRKKMVNISLKAQKPIDRP